MNPGKGAKNQKRKLTVANLLIDIALQEAKLWQSDSGDTWADITVNGVFQWHPVRSKAFNHGIKREVFLFRLVDNLEAYMEPVYRNWSFAELAAWWRERWLLPRSQRVDGWRAWRKEEIERLLMIS